jgi:hypothetical protein
MTQIVNAFFSSAVASAPAWFATQWPRAREQPKPPDATHATSKRTTQRT